MPYFPPYGNGVPNWPPYPGNACPPGPGGYCDNTPYFGAIPTPGMDPMMFSQGGCNQSAMQLLQHLQMMITTLFSLVLMQQAAQQQQAQNPACGPMPNNNIQNLPQNPQALPSLSSFGQDPCAPEPPCTSTPNSGAPGSRENAVIQWALSQNGICEAKNPDTILSYTNGQDIPWCASFVTNAFDQTGGAPWKHGASVSGIRNWGEQNGRYFASGCQSPQPGDVIILQNGISHCAIVTKVENGKVHTIDGNSNNSVRERVRDLNDPKITGYVRPFGQMPA